MSFQDKARPVIPQATSTPSFISKARDVTPAQPVVSATPAAPVRKPFSDTTTLQAGITGPLKSLGKTAFGVGVLGRKIQNSMKSLVGLTPEKTSMFDTGSEANVKATEFLKPKNVSEQSSMLAADIAQYLVPGNAVSKATQGMSLLPRALVRSVPDMAITAAQSQGDAGTTATVGAASVAANLLVPGAGSGLGRKIMSSVVPGYISDVGTGLTGARGEDRTGIKAAIPGMGTAFGVAVPAVTGSLKIAQNIKNPEVRISEKRMGALRDLETKNVKIATVFDAADRKGVDVRKTLAETNLLNGAISPDGRISSDKALSNFGEFIAPYESQVKDALTKENRSIQLNQLVGDAKSFIDNSTLTDRQKVELQQEIASQFDAFAQFRGKAVPVTALHDTKVTLANSNNYLNPGKNIVDKEAARFFKDLVERNTSSMDVAKYNGELSKYYTVREALEKMDRAVVNGGRMGKYFSSLIGSGVGGMVGGPLGAIAGAEVGAKARGGMMSRAFGGDIKTGLTPTSDLISALKPKATGKAAIPDVVMPKKVPVIPDISLVPGKKAPISPVSSLNVKPAVTPVKTKPKARILPWKYEPIPGVNKKLEAFNSGKPNSEGGYIRNPLAALANKQKGNQGVSSTKNIPKLSDIQVEKVTSALDSFDTTPLTVKEAGKTRIEMGNSDDMFRLAQLKAIQDKRPLTNAQLAEASELLKKNGG